MLPFACLHKCILYHHHHSRLYSRQVCKPQSHIFSRLERDGRVLASLTMLSKYVTRARPEALFDLMQRCGAPAICNEAPLR